MADMNKRERLVLTLIGASLIILPLANLAHVASMLEMQLALRHIYISVFSWVLVWLAGLTILIVLVAHWNSDAPS